MDGNLGNAAIFRGVEPNAVDAVTRRLRRDEFAAGHVFFTEGQRAERLFIIISGKVKIGFRAPDGRTYLSTVMGPSDMFGELSLLDPAPQKSTATALTEVCAAPMDRHTLRSWLTDRPEITDRLLGVLARRLRRSDDRRTDFVLVDVAGRVAKQLLALAQQFGVQEDGSMRVTHDLTQEELAQLVGSTRESVNKALTDFSHRGWIRLDGKSMLITNSELLAHRAR